MAASETFLAARPAAAVARPDGEADRVARARRGDREALSRLYEDYRRVVHAAVLARVPAADADDLVQDVFIAAMRRLPGLRSDEAFGGWLLAIARNRATDYWRSARP